MRGIGRRRAARRAALVLAKEAKEKAEKVEKVEEKAEAARRAGASSPASPPLLLLASFAEKKMIIYYAA